MPLSVPFCMQDRLQATGFETPVGRGVAIGFNDHILILFSHSTKLGIARFQPEDRVDHENLDG